MAGEKEIVESEMKDSASAAASTAVKKKRKGILSRIWNGIFRIHGDDFEKRLQYISKEEAAVLSRLKRRSQAWRKITRHLIIFSVIFEVIAVGYAIVTTRSMDLNWKMRAFRVLPMFVLPALSAAAYSSFMTFTRLCDRRDQKTLERLRAERQAKIDELKEKTNYYTTQQLIQRYDTDPAAKAAAATVLASKLGADSGLKVYLGDEPQLDAPAGKSNDFEVVQSRGLRNRKQALMRSNSTGSAPTPDDLTHHTGGSVDALTSERNEPVVVDHYFPQVPATHDGSWISRLAALLVGEDPTQSYALICGNCHMHNGLAKKEDFPYITYYCPHCRALNRPKQSGEHTSGSTVSETSSLKTSGSDNAINEKVNAVRDNAINEKVNTVSDNVTPGVSSVEAGSKTQVEETERLTSRE